MSPIICLEPAVRKAAYHVKIQHRDGHRTLGDIPDLNLFAREAMATARELALQHTPQGFRILMLSGQHGCQPEGEPLTIDLIGGEVLRTNVRADFDPTAQPIPSGVDAKTDAQCVFENFVTGKWSVEALVNEDGVLAFRPKELTAREHVLFIPTTHWRDLLAVDRPEFFGTLFEKVKAYTQRPEFAGGFQLFANNRPWGGQAVPHLHFHLLGAEQLNSPFWQDWQG